MPMRIIRSLRFRLALSYMLVFGLIHMAGSILVITQREKSAASEFDFCLEEQARAMGKVIDIAANGTLSRFDTYKIRRYARAFGCANFYHEVRNAEGSLLERSSNMAEFDFGAFLPPLDELRRESIIMQDISGDAVSQILGEKGRMRLLSYYHVQDKGNPFIIQVAMNLGQLQYLNDELRDSFLRVSLLALLAAGLTGWLLSKRSLEPIGRVEKRVAAIQPIDLGTRLDVDDSGEELEHLTTTVNAMLERLDRAFKAQGDFLSHAAHELKTPLAVLLGDTQRMLRKERRMSEYQDHLLNMEQELRRMSKVISSLLILSKARAGTHQLNEQPISANDFVTDALERCQPLARHREIRLVPRLAFDPSTDEEPIVRGDERLLIAMIENLLRNGIRLSPVGGAIYVGIVIEGERMRITVKDEGPGIPEELRETLFTGFVSKPVHGRRSGGAGIGLAIAHSVAQLHGGDIDVTNPESGGAEFVITLPRYTDVPPPANPDNSEDSDDA